LPRTSGSTVQVQSANSLADTETGEEQAYSTPRFIRDDVDSRM